MYKALLCLIFLFSLISSSNTQEVEPSTFNKYREYRTTFDSEMKKYKDPEVETMPKFRIIQPEEIPKEFLYLPSSDQTRIVSIGISDPGMDKRQGYELALLRAKTLISFFNDLKVEHISEYYTEEYNISNFNRIEEKYVDFYRLSARLAIDTNDITVISDSINKFGETLIVIEYNPTSSTPNEIITSISDCLNTETRSSNYYEINNRIEVNCRLINKSDEEETYHFVSRRIQKNFDIFSKYNGEIIPTPYYTLRYKNSVEIMDTIGENKVESLLSDGLWNGLMDCLFHHLSIVAKLDPSTVKTATDTYSQQIKGINREVASSSAEIRLNNIYIYNNRIQIDLDIY